MESISLLLGEALSPYQVSLSPNGSHGECLVTLKNSHGAIVVEREFNQAQLTDKRQLTDVVDGPWLSKLLVLDLVDFRLLMARHPDLAATIDAEATRRAQENK